MKIKLISITTVAIITLFLASAYFSFAESSTFEKEKNSSLTSAEEIASIARCDAQENNGILTNSQRNNIINHSTAEALQEYYIICAKEAEELIDSLN